VPRIPEVPFLNSGRKKSKERPPNPGCKTLKVPLNADQPNFCRELACYGMEIFLIPLVTADAEKDKGVPAIFSKQDTTVFYLVLV